MVLGTWQFDKFNFLSRHERVRTKGAGQGEQASRAIINKHISRGVFIIKLMELNFKGSFFPLSPSRGLGGSLMMCSCDNIS